MTSRRHQRNASPRFRSIQAVFEQQADALDVPPQRPFSRGSTPKTPTDEQPNPVSNLISRETFKNQRETIDALLEASHNQRWPASREPLRSKSSWIGPPPPPSRLPSHGSAAAMAQKVTITYASPGLQPPVYITTSLGEPPWELLEMDCSESPSGERKFFKTFHATEGEYQYKFRLGPGDWWICDEAMPTVDDGFGDRNNVLVVKENMPARTSAATQPQTDERSDSELGLLSPGPAFAHEREVFQHKEKRDSLGGDVLGKSPFGERDEKEHEHDHHAPLFAHEQNGSPNRKLQVPPEDVPVDFSRQDTKSLDDDDGDVEPSHFPDSPLFAHEKDAEPLRIHTPGVDEDGDYMEEPPLMRHETLSPASANHDHPLPYNHQYHDGYDSDVLVSPVSSHSSLHLSSPEDHVPAEADPNDPSLVPTHHEGILSSLRRASMRMTQGQTAADAHASTSPVTKTKSHSSSQSPSLPSVREDEEEPEDESTKGSEKHIHTAHAKTGAAGAVAGLTMLSESHERPAALMTPPRTPDESKAPHNVSSQTSDHHHKPAAEKDMREEAKHDVLHHESHSGHDQTKAAEKLAGLDGDDEPLQAEKADRTEESKPAGDDKSSWDGFFQTALGLGLTILVGAGAAWLAFRMQDSIKDGGAVLKR